MARRSQRVGQPVARTFDHYARANHEPHRAAAQSTRCSNIPLGINECVQAGNASFQSAKSLKVPSRLRQSIPTGPGRLASTNEPRRLHSSLARRSIGMPASRPYLGSRGEFGTDARPIMKRGWIEIRSVGPNQRAGFHIQDNCIERRKVLKRAEHGAVQHRPKVDVLLDPVVERHREPVRPDYLEPGDAIDGMGHHLSGSILTGGWPDCKRSQSCCSSDR